MQISGLSPIRSPLGCVDSRLGLADYAHSLRTNLTQSTERVGWFLWRCAHILRWMNLSEPAAGTKNPFLKSPESWGRAGVDEPKEGTFGATKRRLECCIGHCFSW